MRNCIICNSDIQVVHYGYVDEQEYLLCNKCGLIYEDKILNMQNIYHSYTGSRLKSFRRKLFSRIRRMPHHRNYRSSLERGDRITGFIKQHLSIPKSEIKLLDIGCNRGFLLEAALKHGWNTYGIELVPEVIQPFRNSHPDLKHQIFNGLFDEVYPQLEVGTFGVITAIDVIEHFIDPVMNLLKIYNLLSPGGLLVIQTPDSDSPKSRELGIEWAEIVAFQHLYLFNRKNLAKLVTDIGFSNFSTYEPFDPAEGNFVATMTK